MNASKMVKSILGDMRKTIEELYDKNLVRDYRPPSCQKTAKESYEISFPGKDRNICNIVYDEHISGENIMDKLLSGQQYSLLLYDKSIIQAEFIVENEMISKERLVFMKKHNKIWTIDEIKEYENNDLDWFSDEQGVPIFLRIDYDPKNHTDVEHPATHLTLSNHKSCRIPIKSVVTFSEFTKFVMFHFYGIQTNLKQCRGVYDDTITQIERKMIHINWE